MDPNFNITAEEEEDTTPPNPTYSLDEDDLYACLNVSKTATTDEITAAYRRFSRIYHPDKHLADKEIAENLFSRVKRAHEILTDPSRRAIYDTLGLEALESQGNELVERYETPQEIREAYERLQRDKQERDMERRTNPKGSMTVNINATEVFNPYVREDDDPFYAEGVFPYVELTGFHFNQSIEAPLTPKDTLTLAGTVNSQNGRGNGNISCGFRRTVSNKSWGELEFGGSTSGLDFGLKGFSQFAKRFFTNFNLICQGSDGNLRTGAVFALGNQLDANTVGTLTWRTGGASNSLVGGCIRDDGTNRIGLTIHLGVPHIYCMVQTSHKREDTKYRFNLKAGTFGAFIEYGIEKKITQYSTVGALMIVGVPHGVILRMKVIRANQSYIFPIQLSDEIIPSAIAYGTLTPILIYLTVKKLFIEPYEKTKEKEEKEKKQKAYQNKIFEKRAEAESAIHLMRNTYERIRFEEESKDGLVIQTALFGRVLAGNDEPEVKEAEIIDVTVPLQCLVKDTTLIVHKGSKVFLPGFYDPAPGEKKWLLIKYRYGNLLHEVAAPDEDEIKIPKRAHRLDETTTGS